MILPEVDIENVRGIAARDLLYYAEICNTETFLASKFHAFMAKKLEAVSAGKLKRVVFTVPPQHGKSTMVCVEFTTWMLGKFPEKRMAIWTYGQALSNKASRLARARMQSDIYQWIFETRLDDGHGAIEDWGTTAGGGYRAVGVDGALTGMALDILIVDDPLKDFAEAHSPAQRQKVWDQFLSNAYTRLAPGGVIIIICTRWHRDDLVGRLTTPEYRMQMEEVSGGKEMFEVYNLPGIAKESDPMGRTFGEALFPERYDADSIRTKMAMLGAYKAAALYDGNPVVQGGQHIPVEKFVLKDRADVPANLRWGRFWDLAATAGETSNSTAGIKGAFDLEGNLWLMDMKQGVWPWPKARAIIASTANAEKIVLGVEANGAFKAVCANLREELQGVMMKEVTVTADKLTRALPWIALVEQGKVRLVYGEWTNPFIEQCTVFSGMGDEADDQIDAVSGLYGMLKAAPKFQMQAMSREGAGRL